MYLATTALHQYWNKKSKIIFLGEWCKTIINQQHWEDLDFQVLPYHWADLNSKYEDFLYIGQLKARVLSQLYPQLNKFNDVNLSKRAWDIIIGQWLRYFIEQIFDRYKSITNASSNSLIEETWIPLGDMDQFTPDDIEGYYFNQSDDLYNLFLFGEVIKFQNKITFKKKLIQTPIRIRHTFSKSIKRKLLDMLVQGRDYIFSRKNNKYVIKDTYLSGINAFKLNLSLQQLLTNDLRTPFPRTFKEVDQQKRLSINLTHKDQFEYFLIKMLKHQIPKSYIELFHDLKSFGENHLGNKTKKIITSFGHFNNETFKIWIASRVDEGAKLYINQHGGNYGLCKYSSSYEHEVEISDRFLTWGWKANNNKVIRSTGLRMVKLKKRPRKLKRTNNFLWCLSSVPRYSDRMYSIPNGPQWKKYIEDQINFYKFLTNHNKNKILCRPFPTNYGWGEKEELMHNFPKLKFDKSQKPIYKIRNNFEIIIETCNQTTFLQSLALNHPTIIFWDESKWELSKIGVEFIKILKDAGIFYPDARSAALKLNQISNDIPSWWNDIQLQEGRAKFCDNFAFIDDDWLSNWTKLIKN